LPAQSAFVIIHSIMRAAVLHETGRSPRLEAFPEPVVAESEVLLTVLAAALKPIDRQLAAGTHFGSPREFPVICGSDGVGRLEDGSRVFFGGPRRPFGAFAERTVVRRQQCFPIPESLDDVTAAAIPNPGVSAWLSLSHRAKLAAGETVLILGATGTTGKLAVQIAKMLGAGRVVATGRNRRSLLALPALGADVTISLNQPHEELVNAFRAQNSEKRFDIVIDYVWGPPTEALLAAITTHEFAASNSEIRLVQVGESAAPAIRLPAAVLRSTALTVTGTAGVPPMEVLSGAVKQVLDYAAKGNLRIDTERLPLSEIESAWDRPVASQRLVFLP
jgi:NADPH:quinone reductase-like Zn-dependent oxidoreductase